MIELVLTLRAFQSSFVAYKWTTAGLGPASTVEEHSLRNISVRGDRGSILTDEISFQTRSFLAKIFAQMFDGNSSNRTSSSYLTTSISERLLRRKILLYEEERSLGNWSYGTRSFKRWAHATVYSTTQHYTNLQQQTNLQPVTSSLRA